MDRIKGPEVSKAVNHPGVRSVIGSHKAEDPKVAEAGFEELYSRGHRKLKTRPSQGISPPRGEKIDTGQRWKSPSPHPFGDRSPPAHLNHSQSYNNYSNEILLPQSSEDKREGR